jgi:probable F420-dependent oxidoreductase
MDFGLILPSYRAGATKESIDASTSAAARLGWHSVFTTDHLLVEPSKRSEDYFTLFDALNTLAYLAAREPTIRLGASVVVVPMRNAVELAKELATIDALSEGRLIVGVGVGWNQTEFEHLGYGDRFSQRGAYLTEAVTLWRQLWSGSTNAFHGRFHSWDEVRFAPLPAQGAELPIWFGGRDDAALRRAGRMGQGYHSSASGHDQLAVRIPIINAAAADAGRPAPVISARVRVQFGPNETPFYMLAGTRDQMIAEIRAFEAVGTGHMAFDFAETDPDECVRLMERFDTEVLAAFR